MTPATPSSNSASSSARIQAATHELLVSYSKVRAITRVATPETDAALLDAARGGTASQVERIVRAWRRVDRAVAARKPTAGIWGAH